MKLDYLLTGVIEGSYIELIGTGNIDQPTGRFDLKLDSVAAPIGWDPGIIIMICCDNLRFYSAQQKPNSVVGATRNGLRSLQFGSMSNDHRQGTIVDKLGETVVHMKAKGFLFIEDDVVKSRTVITQGFSRLNKFGGIATINTPYQEIITPTGPNTATGLSTYQLVCADGTTLYGHTVYPYVFNDGPALGNQTTLEVHVASSNSQAFLKAGVAPELNVSVQEV